jgi:fused signal recognition particle receptor
MALFWKRKRHDEKTEQPQSEQPEAQPTLMTRFKQAVTNTRQNIAKRIDAAVGGSPVISEEALDQLEEALVGADIGVSTALDVIEKAREQVKRSQLGDVAALKAFIKSELKGILDSAELNRKQGTVTSETEIPLDVKPYVVMVVGVNGVGKTTTIGKLAYRIKSEGNSVMICAADTFRAAANDQLAIWADRTGVPIIQQKPGTDPSAVLFDSIAAARARGADVLIVDTAGRLHTKSNLMQELDKMRRIASREVQGAPHEVLLVMDAVTGQNGLEQARQFARTVPVTGLALTKLDGTAKGGIVIAIARELGIPIRYVGLGEQKDDLVEFSADAYVAGLFE